MVDSPIPTADHARDHEPRATRLAPSPTGALHLGNARTFLVNWALARQCGWDVIMRMEDLDGPRVKQGAAQQALDVLAWLGLDWDGEVSYQSADLSPYHAALEKLRGQGSIYHCRCSRKEIAAAQSAPHEGGELRYPGTCRPDEADHRAASDDEPALLAEDAVAWRLRAADEAVTFEDAVVGSRSVNVQRQAGDFIVATKAGLPSYQLAVVVDDARQGVTDIVRGDDLINSTARQMLLYRALGLGEPPRYYHLPLVLGSDGRRLAKRHGDTRLSRYREAGVPAERIVGLIAFWSGVVDEPEAMSADEFRERFDLTALPREPITFTEEQAEWLQATVHQ